jgi:hypothetical protein
MDPDQAAHLHSLIRLHAVYLQTLLQVEKLTANSMDPDQTAQMRRLVWIHAGRKCIILVFSWRGSILKYSKITFSIANRYVNKSIVYVVTARLDVQTWFVPYTHCS